MEVMGFGLSEPARKLLSVPYPFSPDEDPDGTGKVSGSSVPKLHCGGCGKSFDVHLHWDPGSTGVARDGIAKLRVTELPGCCGPVRWSEVGELLVVPETAAQLEAHKRRIIGKALSEEAERMARKSWDRVWKDVAVQLGAEVEESEVSAEPDAAPKAEFQDRRKFLRRLLTLLGEPIEDGIAHPAEVFVEDGLRMNRSVVCDWLWRAVVEDCRDRPSAGASIIRVIGRQSSELVRQWGLRIADEALQHGDAEVREAGIRALEAWGGSDALGILRRHVDAEPWLNSYIAQVLRDLSELDHFRDVAEKVVELRFCRRCGVKLDPELDSVRRSPVQCVPCDRATER